MVIEDKFSNKLLATGTTPRINRKTNTEAAWASEMLVSYNNTTWHWIPEDLSLKYCCHESLKTYSRKIMLQITLHCSMRTHT